MSGGHIISNEWRDPELNPFDPTLPPGIVSSISMCYTLQREIYGIRVKAKVPAGRLRRDDSDGGSEEPLSFEKAVKKFKIVLEKIGKVADIRYAEVQSAIDEKEATRPRLIHSMRENARKSKEEVEEACKAAFESLELIDGAPPANFRTKISEALDYYLKCVIDHRPRVLGISPPLR